MKVKATILWIVTTLMFALYVVHAQQPQSTTAPDYGVSARYVQGVGLGYRPTPGAGLVLNIAAGTAFCGGSIVSYAGGTKTMTDNTTNYVYLDTASSCAVTAGTSVFTAAQIPIAKVVTSSGAITAITDDRTPFAQAIAATGSTTVNGQTCSIGSSCTVHDANLPSETDTDIIYGASGAWTKGTALPNGITATTQTAADNSTKVATTAYVDTGLSGKAASVNISRACDMAIGDTSGSAITSAQLGPQKRMCYIPAAATIVEMDVAADGGTPNVIVAVDHAGSNSNIVSGALATGSSGAIACSKTTNATGIDGATTCTNTLQNTSIAAGDYLELVSGTAGGTAKLMTIHVIYTIN